MRAQQRRRDRNEKKDRNNTCHPAGQRKMSCHDCALVAGDAAVEGSMRAGIRKKSRSLLLDLSKNEMKTNQTKEMDLRQANCVVYQLRPWITHAHELRESVCERCCYYCCPLCRYLHMSEKET